MKKLIIAAAIICAGVTSQASNVNWGMTGAIDDTIFASGTAYLICVDNIAKPSLTAESAATWYAANSASLASKAFRTASVTDGAIYETEDISQAIGRKNYWLLIDNNVDGDDHYIAVSTTTKALNITTSSLSVSANWLASSQMSNFNVAPEPTSGLLMLLGMAGLALRRKRA